MRPWFLALPVILFSGGLLESTARAEDAPYPSRFYWHEALGAGVLTAQSNFVNGTRAFVAPTFNLVSTFAARVARPVAVGGALDLYIIPPLTVTEDRSLGHKDLASPFGVAGVLGPSVALLPGSFRFDLTPGLFWLVAAHADNGGAGGAIGGAGFGGTIAAAYDIPLGRRVALGFELRGVLGSYGNGDKTHTGGLSGGVTALVALRAR